ncbi:MAG: hypothetical protein J1F64_03135 [Oscillospiraceae bacterium]|nr:hypothetical protein [Oscillospiraceae bacterium]
MYRKYYSYNDMPTVADIRSDKNNNSGHEDKSSDRTAAPEVGAADKNNGLQECVPDIEKPEESRKLFGRFENDDILLLVVIFILLADGCDDDLLILALAAVFLFGKG